MNWYKTAQENTRFNPHKAEPTTFNWGKIDNLGSRLEQKANSQCKKLGHLLNEFTYSKDMRTGERLGRTECRNCALWVGYSTGSDLINMGPKIEGPAAKLKCEPPVGGTDAIVFDPAYMWDEKFGDFRKTW